MWPSFLLRARILKRAFIDLSPWERVFFVARIVTSLMVVILAIVSLLSNIINDRFNQYTLTLAHVDVSAGLFTTLRSNIASSSSSYNPSNSNGVGFTASEIYVLSNYVATQVEGSPQFVASGLWSWCIGNYTVTYRTSGSAGDWVIDAGTTTFACDTAHANYVFDYRDMLSANGLDVILAYAYNGDDRDAEYLSFLAAMHRTKRVYVAGYVCVGVFQILILVATFVSYTRTKHRLLDESHFSSTPSSTVGSPRVRSPTKPRKRTSDSLLHHGIAVLSLATVLASCVASAVTTADAFTLQNRIADELKSFGIMLVMGRRWFACIWIGFGAAAANAALWGGPLWCANPTTWEPTPQMQSAFRDVPYESDAKSVIFAPFREFQDPGSSHDNVFADQVYNGFSDSHAQKFHQSARKQRGHSYLTEYEALITVQPELRAPSHMN